MGFDNVLTDTMFWFDDLLQAGLNVAHAAEGPSAQLPAGTRPRRGDIVAADRGVFWHYGIYESDAAVYHYQDALPLGQKGRVAKTSFAAFVAASEEHFVLGFSGETTPWIFRVPYTPEPRGERLPVGASGCPAARGRSKGLYSRAPDTIIAAARRRLGEAAYDLLENNCEHFALACNVGRKASLQVARFDDVLAALTGQFHSAR